MSHTGIQIISVACVLLLVAVHLLTDRLRFLSGTPRSAWLSIAGGVSVAYVFVHLLPELAASQRVISNTVGEGLKVVENHVYIIALIGLAFFYGIHRVVSGPATTSEKVDAASRRGTRRAGTAVTTTEMEETTSVGVFWVNVSSFTLYNVLIGYLLLHRIGRGVGNLILFTIAMALHFLVTDHGLYERHGHIYRRIGRWVLVAAVLIGWLISLFEQEIPEAVIAVLTALLAGGVILNVLKEELPRERQSRFLAFAAGAFVYTVILLVVG